MNGPDITFGWRGCWTGVNAGPRTAYGGKARERAYLLVTRLPAKLPALAAELNRVPMTAPSRLATVPTLW